MLAQRIEIQGGADPHMVAAVTAAVERLLEEEVTAAGTQPPRPTLDRLMMQARWCGEWRGESNLRSPLPFSR